MAGQPMDMPASSKGTKVPVSLPTLEGTPAATLEQECSASGQPMDMPASSKGTKAPVSLSTLEGAPAATLEQECSARGQPMDMPASSKGTKAPVSLPTLEGAPAATLEQECSTSGSVDHLGHIKLPATMKHCGRPKRRGQTVIGLPTKRRCTRPVSFTKKAPADRAKVMLGWLVDSCNLEAAMNGTKISEHMVEVLPKKVSSAILDDACSLADIKPYFDDDAWLCVMALVEMKKRKPVWFCPTCKKLIG
nr:uncharacterized protein LOC129380166 isoform X2 [Dermacentor andersoni]